LRKEICGVEEAIIGSSNFTVRGFEQELGRGRKYVDRDHALWLATAVPDWQRVRRSASFCRFAEKAARVRFK
jgi:hypothetical protein